MYSKMLSLRFPEKVINEPVVVNLVKKFDLSFNILKATIYPRKEALVVMELTGHRKNFQKGVRYLKSLGIKVENLWLRENLRHTNCQMLALIHVYNRFRTSSLA